MNGATVIISPLSWGFGHAGRMIPVARELKKRGCDVIFAADASLLQVAAAELPGISLVRMPGLKMRYSRHLPQYICIFMQTPLIIASAVREHRVLRRLVKEYKPSVIISDNRFGFFHSRVFSVYVTHQLRIAFPAAIRFMEPLAVRIHRLVINRFDLCMVPDFPGGGNLSGRLSHDVRLPHNTVYGGPLSRFAGIDAPGAKAGAGEAGGRISVAAGDTADNTVMSGLPGSPYACLILSGPEPQRTLFLEKVAHALRGVTTVVLTATAIPDRHRAALPAVIFVTAPGTASMHRIITASSLVVARAGYTSVMELFSLGKGAVIIPTPGQPEQEYLGRHLNGRYGFITMKQGQLGCLAGIAEKAMAATTPLAEQGVINGFADALLEKAMKSLPEKKKK